MFNFASIFTKSAPVDPKASIKEKMVQVADVLAEEGVFGSDAEYLSSEKRSFIGQAMGQVGRTDTIEMTYRGTAVRVLIDVLETAKEFKAIQFVAVPHPFENEDMDYIKLNERLKEIQYS